MRITDVETIRLAAIPNLVLIQLGTDEGLVGLGETYFGAEAVESYVHETVAPNLLGKDPLAIEAIRRSLAPYVGFQAPGVEVRGNSAVDIACMDLLGQAAGLPLYQLIGGRSREVAPVYNTCAGYHYSASGKGGTTAQWGVGDRTADRPYEDLDAFMHRADELAESLVEQGYMGMKIWPLDALAEECAGLPIPATRLRAALEPLRRIREAVGTSIEILVELHSLWSLPAARSILAALEEFEPYWYEDPIPPRDVRSVALQSREVKTPIATGETLAGVPAYTDLIDAGFAGIVLVDMGWAGGISEARKIAAIAESRGLPVAAHDCTGPVVLTASTHFAVSAPNALVQEVVRAYYYGWYADLVTELPTLENGTIRPPEGAGLGIALQPDIRDRPGAMVRHSVG